MWYIYLVRRGRAINLDAILGFTHYDCNSCFLVHTYPIDLNYYIYTVLAPPYTMQNEQETQYGRLVVSIMWQCTHIIQCMYILYVHVYYVRMYSMYNVYMYECMYVCTYIYMYIGLFVCMYVYVRIRTYMYMCVCVCVCTSFTLTYSLEALTVMNYLRHMCHEFFR